MFFLALKLKKTRNLLISAGYQNLYFELDHKIFYFFHFFMSNTGAETSFASGLALYVKVTIKLGYLTEYSENFHWLRIQLRGDIFRLRTFCECKIDSNC
jgi:hypothetical protein